MTKRSDSWRAAMAGLVAAGLAGCGGGGSDTVPPPLVDAQPLAITAANHETVARQVTMVSSYMLDTGGLVNGAQVAPDVRTLLRFARGQLTRVGTLLQALPQRVAGATVTDTVPCSGGGSMTVTANDANGSGSVDSGDSATMVATNCVEAGATLNGTLAMVINSFSGNPQSSVFSIGAAVTLTNLRATTGAGEVVGNGDMTMLINSTGVDRVTLDVRSTQMQTSGQIAGVADTLTLQNWHVTSASVPGEAGATTTITTSGTLISAALGDKSVVVATPVALAVRSGDTYPSSGQFTASGAAASRLQVTALDAATARLELDANGDGVYEQSANRPWTALN